LAFSALKLHPNLLKGVDALGFVQPTPIQAESIPHAMEGRDLLACAATGSGKTAAFLLPILHQLVDRPRGTTRALVLAPTRELALQILDDLNGLARYTGLKAAAVHGGVGMGPQETAFRKGADVIVATPGRLLDHFQYGYAALAGLEYLVLDEADRMLDMGFLPDIKRVLKHVPKPKQTFFFSATMPPPIEKLTHEILRTPAKIALQRRAAPPKAVTQAVYPVRQTLKGTLLVELFRAQHMDDALVFTRTKHRADRLCKLLNRNGITAERIHGNRSQAQRTRALDGFKDGDFQVLVATDIAARGIDVESLGHVVNFDVPTVPEDYIHRVGRTARAAETGDAITLVAAEDEEDLKRIERTVGYKIPRQFLEGFAYDAAPDDGPLEVPIKDRIAAIRAKKAEDRARAKAKGERKEQSAGSAGGSGNGRSSGSGRSSGGGRSTGGGRSSGGGRDSGKPRRQSVRGGRASEGTGAAGRSSDGRGNQGGGASHGSDSRGASSGSDGRGAHGGEGRGSNNSGGLGPRRGSRGGRGRR
jgi:ATP-dependent RNA helicase RhlE